MSVIKCSKVHSFLSDSWKECFRGLNDIFSVMNTFEDEL